MFINEVVVPGIIIMGVFEGRFLLIDEPEWLNDDGTDGDIFDNILERAGVEG